MFSYCVTKDKDNEKVYLVSYHEEEIDAYCKENDLEVLSKPKYVAVSYTHLTLPTKA